MYFYGFHENQTNNGRPISHYLLTLLSGSKLCSCMCLYIWEQEELCKSWSISVKLWKMHKYFIGIHKIISYMLTNIYLINES